MTKAQVLAFLEEEQDERGIANWDKSGGNATGMKSYGIGLTRLRKYSKQWRPDAKLAKQLWKTKVYEARVIALLIDDPKTMTIEQAEDQVEQLHGGYLAHVFSSCDATLAKTPFVFELMERWVKAKDETRKRCGHGLLYEISKSKKKSAPDDATFLRHVERIEKTYEKQSIDVLMSMAGALMGIGKRSMGLNAAALRVAKKIGPIDFDPDGRCDPFDVAKHLTRKAIRLGS